MNLRRLLTPSRQFFYGTTLVLVLSGCANVTLSDPIEPPPVIPPSATAETLVVLPTASASPRARRSPTATRVVEDTTPTPRPSPTNTPVPITYTVQEGDTLGVIAVKHAVKLEDLMAINNLTNAHKLSIGQVLIIPSASDIAGDYGPATTADGNILHFVREGETISAIALQYGTTREDILWANGFRPDVQLYAGDQIIVPQGTYTALATATLPPIELVATEEAIAANGVTETPTVTPGTSAETPTPAPTPTPKIYTVVDGDIAGRIASNNGVTVAALAAANPNANMDSLSIGDQLVIPVTAATTTEGAPAPTPTPVTLEPTATPTPLPPVLSNYTVKEGETWATIAQTYGVSEDALKGYNATVQGDLTAGTSIQIPVGTPTPVPTPTLPPTVTPTPAPAYIEPMPLLPANGSTWIHWPGKSPLTLTWTSSGILAEDEFYVVRVRALDRSDDMIWDESYWTQATSLRLDDETLAQFTTSVTLRWDVMVMRQTSDDGVEPRTGEALSNKSQTYEILFTYTAGGGMSGSSLH